MKRPRFEGPEPALSASNPGTNSRSGFTQAISQGSTPTGLRQQVDNNPYRPPILWEGAGADFLGYNYPVNYLNGL